ncbi:MAG: pyridine nucleotide-disulfide oxidoreductase [Cycloclasticus sp. symbiont of Poecilosclerida sp. M]|nr:MAG: pyridine nucleotide-disulfide oxidoreductase [Cycloclasticus sp. symbiont of Poecilosclerida sp. M]
MKHVIIGAGPSGVVAAEQIRKLNTKASITIIGDEPEAPYSRMAIPYHLIGDIEEKGTHLRHAKGHFKTLNIDVRNARVEAVDSTNKTVSLNNGADVSYDKLLIASGSRPNAPSIPGIDQAGVHSCWTLEDARAIAALAKPGAKVIQIGAGFIACIILEALARRDVDLTVVEMEDRMVPRMMDNVAGNMIQDWCVEKNINVFSNGQVMEIVKVDGDHTFKVKVKTPTGETELDADLVISATGVSPCVDFLADSGIEIDTGIIINKNMETNVPDIYASGDVAQGKDFCTGEYAVQAIQPTATEHGVIVAQNMVGRKGAECGGTINMNVLDTMGLISCSFGLWQGVEGGESSTLVEKDKWRYINLQFEDDVLVGGTAIGMTQHIGVMRGLIQSETSLGKWKDRLLENPLQIMDAYLASTHTAAIR